MCNNCVSSYYTYSFFVVSGCYCFPTLLVGAKDVVVNPKVNNMLNAYENAKYPLFMISDVGIKSRLTRPTHKD